MLIRIIKDFFWFFPLLINYFNFQLFLFRLNQNFCKFADRFDVILILTFNINHNIFISFLQNKIILMYVKFH